MPRKKLSGKTAKPATKITKPSKPSFFEYLRFGESYTSLVLGIIAVIIATVLLLSFVNNRQSNKPDSDIVPTVVDIKDLKISPTPQAGAQGEKTYIVKAGDNLWKIAETVYGNGYNWVDIAKANKLADSGNIHVGDKLLLPSVSAVAQKQAEPAKPVAEEKPADAEKPTVFTKEDEAKVSRTEKLVSDTYKIVAGDNLWDVAVRAYGDGYQWSKIAKANNLSNPDLIHTGNVLKLPRN